MKKQFVLSLILTVLLVITIAEYFVTLDTFDEDDHPLLTWLFQFRPVGRRGLIIPVRTPTPDPYPAP
jgi:hypothetical protein